ncbi:MAG: ABC transporter ATP-binding protein [Actinobacteria bacterium]|nr:MAG: ABC transporter ATP-binding protein [Actinomycetota bacterium]
MSDAILTLEHVDVGFATDDGTVSAVSDVSLSVAAGEIFGLVGESGCGKTTLAMATMGLLPPSATVSGSVRFQGRELVGLAREDLRRLRGDRISMVFQDPMTSLDPAFPIGEQIAETITAHRDVQRAQARDRALTLLADVGIPDPGRRYGDAPHRLSGGMRQRVVIATALANEPALILADEPTTALDVTIQSQILDLLRDLRQRLRTTIVLITHDLGVIAHLCDRVGVMYAGQLVEIATVAEIFRSPRHPYTQALLAALPTQHQEAGSLRVIPGRVPNLIDPPPGCRFASRCPHVMDVCTIVPPLAHESADHVIACWLSEATREAGRPTGAATGGAA